MLKAKTTSLAAGGLLLRIRAGVPNPQPANPERKIVLTNADQLGVRLSVFSVWRELRIMPFQEFSSFFGPDELDAMTAAYNAAWYQLWIAGVAVTPHQVGVVKRKLAQVILASACAGKRDRERLKEVALRALSATTHPR